MKLGLLDSGVGGLNVLKEFINKYPNNEYYFFGDTLNMPYGDKTKEELIKLADYNVNLLITQFHVDMIIVACGTLSSNCMDYLKHKYDIPILDIITPTLNFLKNDNIDNIGVIATSRTIESKVFNIANKNVITKATPELAPIIEKGQIIEKEKLIEDYLEVFKNRIDYLVLGCTHYPLLSDIIKKYLDVEQIDMGKKIVESISLPNNTKQKVILLFSKLSNELIININNIIKVPYEIKEF